MQPRKAEKGSLKKGIKNALVRTNKMLNWISLCFHDSTGDQSVREAVHEMAVKKMKDTGGWGGTRGKRKSPS